MVEAKRLRQLHKRQHPDYKYQPRRRRGQSSLGPKSPSPASSGAVTSANGKPLTPPHTPSEETDRGQRSQGGHKTVEAGDELSMESYLHRYSQYTAQTGHTMQEVRHSANVHPSILLFTDIINLVILQYSWLIIVILCG